MTGLREQRPTSVGEVITDEELRQNYDFVMAFEALRKRYGYREMSDAALQEAASATGLSYEDLRLARHLRNALAHGDAVNRATLERMAAVLSKVVRGGKQIEVDGRPYTTGQTRGALRVHAWLDERLEQEMLANGFVSIGGEAIGDLTGVTDYEWIGDELRRTMPDRKPTAIPIFVGYWRRFLDASAGDLCVLPTRSGTVAIGEFVSPYHYVAAAEPRARHRRNISWLDLGVDRSVFAPDLLSTIKGRHTVQEFRAPAAVHRLGVIAATGSDPGSA